MMCLIQEKNAVGSTALKSTAVVQMISTGTTVDPRLLATSAGGAASSLSQASVQEKERCLRLCNLIYRLHCKLTFDQRIPGEPRNHHSVSATLCSVSRCLLSFMSALSILVSCADVLHRKEAMVWCVLSVRLQECGLAKGKDGELRHRHRLRRRVALSKQQSRHSAGHCSGGAAAKRFGRHHDAPLSRHPRVPGATLV